jgi:hypothetical protein
VLGHPIGRTQTGRQGQIDALARIVPHRGIGAGRHSVEILLNVARDCRTERGTPQGGVASPLLSNILLTPFDREMRRKGYQLTRYADDWVVTCASAAEARAALEAASRVLKELGVTISRRRGLCMFGMASNFSDTRSSEEAGP